MHVSSSRQIIGYRYAGAFYPQGCAERPALAVPVYADGQPAEMRPVRDSRGEPQSIAVDAPLPYGWREDPVPPMQVDYAHMGNPHAFAPRRR